MCFNEDSFSFLISQLQWDHRLPTGKENAGGRLQTFTTGEKGRDVGEEDGVKEVKRSRKHEKDLGGPDFIKRNIEVRMYVYT